MLTASLNHFSATHLFTAGVFGCQTANPYSLGEWSGSRFLSRLIHQIMVPMTKELLTRSLPPRIGRGKMLLWQSLGPYRRAYEEIFLFPFRQTPRLVALAAGDGRNPAHPTDLLPNRRLPRIHRFHMQRFRR